jgi:hypothetical protein
MELQGKRVVTVSVTRILLGVILLLVGFLVLRPVLTPAIAQGQARGYDHIRFMGGFVGTSGAVMVLLDARNGNLWLYGVTNPTVSFMGKISDLGKPLTQAD